MLRPASRRGLVAVGTVLFVVVALLVDIQSLSAKPLNATATAVFLAALLIVFSAATYEQLKAGSRDAVGPTIPKYARVPMREGAVSGPPAAAGHSSVRLQTDSEASFNIVNMYVGVGLWSLPYSLVVGGWQAMLVLLVLLVLCFMSAEVLVRLYDRSPRKSAGEVGSYLQIADDAFGAAGKYSAGFFLVGEFFGTAMVLLLTIWDVLSKMGVEYTAGAVISTLLLAPFIWFDEWSNLAYINAFALLATLIVVLCTHFILVDTAGVANTSGDGPVTTAGFVHAVGLQMVALGSGTPAVPSIYQQVASRRTFADVLFKSFGVIAVLCAAMAVGGFLAYGEGTEMLVIDNLMVHPIVGSAISFLVATASFATTPPFIAMTTEIPMALGSMRIGSGGRRAMRYGVFTAVVVGCVAFKENLDLVLEVTGLLCMSMTAIVYPMAMALKVFYDRKSALAIAASVVAIVVSLATTLVYLEITF